MMGAKIAPPGEDALGLRLLHKSTVKRRTSHRPAYFQADISI